MELYQQVEQHAEEGLPLTGMIAEIYSTLLPRRKFRAEGLTEMQALALVYEHMRAPLAKLRQRIEAEVAEGQGSSHPQQSDQDGQGEQGQGLDGEDGQQQGNGQQGQEEQEQDEDGLQGQAMENQEHQGQQDAYGGNQQDGQQGEEQEQNPSQMVSEEDIGLYGEDIDEQNVQDYQNEDMGDDPEFGNFALNKLTDKHGHNPDKGETGGNEDEYVEDNFDQFREIQRENNAQLQNQQPNEIQKQIEKFEERAMQGKNWVLGGEVKAKERPLNSLLGQELEFKSGIKFSHEIDQNYNKGLEGIIQQRILDQIFDDRVRYIPPANLGRKNGLQEVSTQKSDKGLAELYEIQFKNSLGLGDNKNQKLKKEIMDSLKEVNYYLDSLSNTGFAIKPNASIQKNGRQAIVLQDKVPVTSWNGTTQITKTNNKFQADKEVNKKTHRLRNKRNARQRKKQQDKKKMNKAIEYGGVTKFEAEARKKISKTKQSSQNIKYSKSNSFFSNINSKSKPGKPNPNISKLKV